MPTRTNGGRALPELLAARRHETARSLIAGPAETGQLSQIPMTVKKETTGRRRSKAQAAADNAANNVTEAINETIEQPRAGSDRPFMRFADPAAAGHLIDLERGGSIGALADVFYYSGYFGELTPAQIAVQILAGQVLGLKAVESMFDLKIENGRVAFRDDRSIEPAKTSNADPGVVDGRILEFARTIEVDDLEPARGADVISFPENANKGPLLTAEPANGPDSVPVPERLTGLKADEMAANSTPASEPEPAKTVDDMSNDEFLEHLAADPATPPPASPAEPATVDPLMSAGAGGTGDVLLVVKEWRSRIETWLTDLKYSAETVNNRLAAFDEMSTAKQRETFEQAQTFYRGRCDAGKARIITALVADGKSTLDQQQGFFAYAEMPPDPAAWEYKHIARGLHILGESGPTQNNPKPAA